MFSVILQLNSITVQCNNNCPTSMQKKNEIYLIKLHIVISKVQPWSFYSRIVKRIHFRVHLLLPQLNGCLMFVFKACYLNKKYADGAENKSRNLFERVSFLFRNSGPS